MAKTMEELGEIMMATFTPALLEVGYGHSCEDPINVGLSALLWGDIDTEGNLS